MGTTNCPDGCQTPFFLPHETCRKYWQCHNGISYEFSCMENLEWNPKLEFCDYKGSSGCKLEGFEGMSLDCPKEKPSRVPLAAILGFIPLRINTS
ncbi:unnamed protein product [Ceutorhynchus assimilis]|uniref:Chitin-binding type-2 domain-containing protein n=1 Tax=Ceutorhynchus assimilis TaxID=467358 RepID=A0A9N9QN69_9CUCU|nr:unnamed protein product [Ceutorhynchus assimilis]